VEEAMPYPGFILVSHDITTTNTHTIVTGGGAYVFDSKFHLIGFFPEKGFPGEVLNAMSSAVDVISNTQGVRGADALQQHAAQFITAAAAAVQRGLTEVLTPVAVAEVGRGN
jgi:hypothetical protein